MAIQSAVLTFALPEDMDSDQLLILSSATKDGTYTTDVTVDYEYGTTQYEYDALNDTQWYKIQFKNSQDSELGPLSEPVYGGTFSSASPFLAVGTSTDGAQYATSQDVYDYSGLTPTDVPQSKISVALRRARALIDFRTAEMGLDRFALFTQDVARRKFNAQVRLIRECEIFIALANVYISMSDDVIVGSLREGGSTVGDVSIGGVTLGRDTVASRPESVVYLSALADRYNRAGEAILSALAPTSVRIVSDDWTHRRGPYFQFPNPSIVW